MLGFNRLSIIDIAHSHQPLRWGPAESPDRYVLVFNGEIYNYLELREELAAGHGATFAHRRRRRGDHRRLPLLGHRRADPAARHVRVRAVGHRRAGIVLRARPVRHQAAVHGDRIGGHRRWAARRNACSTSPTSSASTSASTNAPCSTTRCCSTCRSPRRCTAACGGWSPAATPGCGPAARPQVTRYFTPRFAAEAVRRAGGEQSRYDEITAVLEDSVAKHMRADVTVGAFLSGGIDSTAIAALAMRHNPRLITFTTGFEREGFSEVDVAVASAEAIGARHVTKVVSQAEFVVRAARDRLVSRRTRRRPRAGAAVLHRPRGAQARQGRAVRRGRRRAVRRLHDLPGTVVAEAFQLSSPPAAPVDGQGVARRCPRACAARACCTGAR